MNNVRWPTVDRESSPASLTFLDAYLWSVAGGDGLFLPGIRVPLANVRAWWIQVAMSWTRRTGVPGVANGDSLLQVSTI